MCIKKENAQDELDHSQKMVKALNDRRRLLELLIVQKGINADPATSIELDGIIDKTDTYEDKIYKIQIVLAEGIVPITEAEYRVTVADAWDSSNGRLSIAQASRMELSRLKLGIQPERANLIELEIKASIVREIFENLNLDLLIDLQKEGRDSPTASELNIGAYGESSTIHIEYINVEASINMVDQRDSAFRLLGKAIRINVDATRDYLFAGLGEVQQNWYLEVDAFRRRLFSENRIWIDTSERMIFDRFVIDFQSKFATPSRNLIES